MTPLELKDARLKLGLTQKYLALHLGIAKSTLANYEQGRQEIPKMLVLALASFKQNNVNCSVPI